MNTEALRADEFIRAFAHGLLQRAALPLGPAASKRCVGELEQAIQQRLGVALFERLRDEDIQLTVREFLNGTPSRGIPSDFVKQELMDFAAEFLQAVRTA